MKQIPKTANIAEDWELVTTLADGKKRNDLTHSALNFTSLLKMTLCTTSIPYSCARSPFGKSST